MMFQKPKSKRRYLSIFFASCHVIGICEKLIKNKKNRCIFNINVFLIERDPNIVFVSNYANENKIKKLKHSNTVRVEFSAKQTHSFSWEVLDEKRLFNSKSQVEKYCKGSLIKKYMTLSFDGGGGGASFLTSLIENLIS